MNLTKEDNMSHLQHLEAEEKIYEEVCSDTSTSMQLEINAVMISFRCGREEAIDLIAESKIEQWRKQQ
jgi:hypothetical protein